MYFIYLRTYRFSHLKKSVDRIILRNIYYDVQFNSDMKFTPNLSIHVTEIELYSSALLEN